MQWVLRVYMDVDPSELVRFITADVDAEVSKAVAPLGATGRVVGVQRPATVDLQFTGQAGTAGDAAALVAAVRTHLGLRPGAIRVPGRPNPGRSPRFGGVRGQVKICRTCSGVDGKHDWSKH